MGGAARPCVRSGNTNKPAASIRGLIALMASQFAKMNVIECKSHARSPFVKQGSQALFAGKASGNNLLKYCRLRLSCQPRAECRLLQPRWSCPSPNELAPWVSEESTSWTASCTRACTMGHGALTLVRSSPATDEVRCSIDNIAFDFCMRPSTAVQHVCKSRGIPGHGGSLPYGRATRRQQWPETGNFILRSSD